mgnify:CR=1 FL=1
MNYDLDTPEGMNNAIKWTHMMLNTIKEGGMWCVPRSGTFIQLNKKDKIATITVGFAPDPSLKRVIKAMGWTVVEK